MHIDCIVLSLRSCRNVESLSPSRFLRMLCFYPSAMRPSDGDRREDRECEIPKSVGALHQSANALILTTDLFHTAASACPAQNTALRTGVLQEF